MSLPRAALAFRCSGSLKSKLSLSTAARRSFSTSYGLQKSARPSLSTRLTPPTTLGAASRAFWWSSTPTNPSTPSPPAAESAPPPISTDSAELSPSTLPPSDLYKSEALPSVSQVVDPLSPASVPPVDGSITDLITGPLANGDHIGDFAALGLGGWTPTGLIQTLLEQIHVTTGMPWWATILTLAAMVRISTLPLHIRVTANNSRMAYVTPEIKKVTEEIQKAKDTGDKNELMKAAVKMRHIYTQAGANPLVGLLGIVQVPIALSMFFGVKWICDAGVESLKHGGLFWFTDLTLSDPTYMLPILSTGAIMTMLKLSAADTPKTPETAHMTNAFLIMSGLSIPLVAHLPAGVMLYFIGNGALQAVQSAVFRIPAVRKWAGILPPPPPSSTVPAPSLTETVQAGWNKLRGFNKQKFEEIKADAYAKAERDIRRREAAKKREAATPKRLLSNNSQKLARKTRP